MADIYGIHGDLIDGYESLRRSNIAEVYYEICFKKGRIYRKYCTEKELEELQEREHLGTIKVLKIYTKNIHSGTLCGHQVMYV